VLWIQIQMGKIFDCERYRNRDFKNEEILCWKKL